MHALDGAIELFLLSRYVEPLAIERITNFLDAFAHRLSVEEHDEVDAAHVRVLAFDFSFFLVRLERLNMYEGLALGGSEDQTAQANHFLLSDDTGHGGQVGLDGVAEQVLGRFVRVVHVSGSGTELLLQLRQRSLGNIEHLEAVFLTLKVLLRQLNLGKLRDCEPFLLVNLLLDFIGIQFGCGISLLANLFKLLEEALDGLRRANVEIVVAALRQQIVQFPLALFKRLNFLGIWQKNW